nr:hypothetical protein [Tanacetum cinerariifolium]
SWCSFVMGEGGSGEGESCGGSGVDWRRGEMVEKWLAGKLVSGATVLGSLNVGEMLLLQVWGLNTVSPWGY